MFRRIGHVLLIVALLGATGGHWMVLQSIAWAKMLADNSRTATFSEALQKTFDGKHPCCLCKQIASGKQSERKAEFQSEFKQFEFLSDQLAFNFQPPTDFRLLPEYSASADLLAETPPVPPPRYLQG